MAMTGESPRFFQKSETDIRTQMAGFPKRAIDLAIRMRATGDLSMLEPLVSEASTIYRPKNTIGRAHTLSLDTRLREDLGLDSLSLTEMAFMFDELFGVPIETREVAGILTLGQLTTFLREKLCAGMVQPSIDGERGAAQPDRKS
jgi:acyl carrier protein